MGREKKSDGRNDVSTSARALKRGEINGGWTETAGTHTRYKGKRRYHGQERNK